jgi:hypothetical protein
MSTLFCEAEADAEVAKNIAKHKRQQTLIKESYKMHIVKTHEGEIVHLVSYEVVTRNDIVELINIKKQEIAELISDLETFNALEAGLTVEDQSAAADKPAAPAETPAQPAPAVQDSQVNHEVVSQPASAAEAPVAEAAPVADAAPVEQPVSEEKPAEAVAETPAAPTSEGVGSIILQ